MYDLHVHTTASDGVYTPVEVIHMAEKIGLRGIAITDHDTLEGLNTARDLIASESLSIDVIPGVELNTDYGDDEVHILGYFIEDNDGILNKRLDEIKLERHQRAERIISRLEQLGIHINLGEVKKQAGGGVIGRPHIARAIRDKGYTASEQEAFDLYIAHGKPAYVPRYKFTPEEAIHLIKYVGGISVLAHPGLIGDHSLIGRIIAMGIEGLEVFYPEHNQNQIDKLIVLARQHNLQITGGSDFHGTGPENRNKLGCCGINDQNMMMFREFCQQK